MMLFSALGFLEGIFSKMESAFSVCVFLCRSLNIFPDLLENIPHSGKTTHRSECDRPDGGDHLKHEQWDRSVSCLRIQALTIPPTGRTFEHHQLSVLICGMDNMKVSFLGWPLCSLSSHAQNTKSRASGTCVWSMLVVLFSVTLSFKMRQRQRGEGEWTLKMWLKRSLVLTLLERSCNSGVISRPHFSFKQREED